MTITKNCVVSINYTLKDDEGTVLDSSENTVPLEYIHGNNQLIPGLEAKLVGHWKGEKFENLIVEARDAYGEYNPNWVQEVPRSQFDVNMPIELGMQFQADTATGPVFVTVTKLTDSTVTVDANHELAGKRLHFDVEIVDVREASEDELFRVNNSAFADSCSCGGSCGSGCGGSCDSCGGCGGL